MWVSKKKWEQLKSKLKAQKAEIESQRTMLEKYKKLYADELQKRLELAGMVREKEGK